MPRVNFSNLAERIAQGTCTPFLGAGVSKGLLPDDDEVIAKWISEHSLPAATGDPLAHVAELIELRRGPNSAKQDLARQLKDAEPDDPLGHSPNYAILSQLPAKIYVTTNFDDCLARALESQGRRPRRVVSAWNHRICQARDPMVPGVTKSPAGEPTVDSPWVYHFHGHRFVPETMVLTKSDYSTFLARLLSGEHEIIDPAVTGLVETLLVLGYRTDDLNFRVIFEGLLTGQKTLDGMRNITVQRPQSPGECERELATLYYDRMNFDVYWGDLTEFLNNLGNYLPGSAGGF